MMSLDPHAPVPGQVGDSRSATSTFHSAVRAWPCSSMVSAMTAAPCSRTMRHDPREPGVGPVAVLVVDRVDDRAAAGQLQAGLDHRRLGRVEHQRQRGRGGQPARHLAHVGHAVPADVVHADVEQVRAVAGLRPRDLDAVLAPPSSIASRNALDPLALVRSPMARNAVSWRNGTCCVERGDAGLGTRPARGDRAGRRPGRPARAMCSGVVPQQPPTRRQAELAGEPLVRVGQLRRGQRVAARRSG